ncbi:MAG: substrate-binding domain-containing protein [Gemmatimonadota bacterium]
MRRKRRGPPRARCAPLLLGLLSLASVGCGGGPRPLLVGATTSVHDSGLFDELIPAFEAAQPELSVKVIAVGSGEALALGRRGDVDVLVVHAPAAEREFVEAGYGHDRTPFMRNDFVIAGPAEDPAGARGAESAAAALRTIARLETLFVSRGDGSGTHLRERELWEAAGVEPSGSWYREIGQGMGATLQVASERRAYLLTDRATLVGMGRSLDLEVLVEGDSLLRNFYSVIEVSDAGNADGAHAFARWLTSPEGIRRIDAFGRERFGVGLFSPLPRTPGRTPR